MATTSTTVPIRYEKRAKQVISARFSSTPAYTYTEWSAYGEVGKSVTWADVLNYADFTVGDSILVTGDVSDRVGATAQLIGLVTSIEDGITATTQSLAISGGRGARMRGIAKWSEYAENPIMMLSGADGEEYYDVVANDSGALYLCKQSHMWSESIEPGTAAGEGYWVLADNQTFIASTLILSKDAVIKHLGVEYISTRDDDDNILFEAKDGKVTCNTGNFKNINITSEKADEEGNTTKVEISSDSGEDGMTIYYNDVPHTSFIGSSKTKDELYGDSKVTTDIISHTNRNQATATQKDINSVQSGDFNGYLASYEFSLSERALVSFNGGGSTKALVTATSQLVLGTISQSGVENMGYVMLSKKGTDGTYTAIRTNTFDAGFVGGVEGSSAGITATVPAYTVALDSGDYKFVIYSKIAISVFDSTDLDLLARCDVATGLSITIDPTAYSSIFCGNGFAFGTLRLSMMTRCTASVLRAIRGLGLRTENYRYTLQMRGTR
jgi:hypothetical protein